MSFVTNDRLSRLILVLVISLHRVGKRSWLCNCIRKNWTSINVSNAGLEPMTFCFRCQYATAWLSRGLPTFHPEFLKLSRPLDNIHTKLPFLDVSTCFSTLNMHHVPVPHVHLSRLAFAVYAAFPRKITRPSFTLWICNVNRTCHKTNQTTAVCVNILSRCTPSNIKVCVLLLRHLWWSSFPTNPLIQTACLYTTRDVPTSSCLTAPSPPHYVVIRKCIDQQQFKLV